MAPRSSHHAGVPNCPALNSNHISKSSTEGSVKQPASFIGTSSFPGLLKLTLLLGGGSSGDQGCMPHMLPWGWLWLLALAWLLDWPLEQALHQFLEWVLDWCLECVLDWLLLCLHDRARDLLLRSLPSLSILLWRASAVSNALCGPPKEPHHNIPVGPIQPTLPPEGLNLRLWWKVSAFAVKLSGRRVYPE